MCRKLLTPKSLEESARKPKYDSGMVVEGTEHRFSDSALNVTVSPSDMLLHQEIDERRRCEAHFGLLLRNLSLVAIVGHIGKSQVSSVR